MKKPLTSNEVIVVKVNGIPYETFCDADGVQRFRSNGVVRFLLDTGKVDLNNLWCMFRSEYFTKREFMEFYMSLGYSVCEFADVFPEEEIINPLWEEV